MKNPEALARARDRVHRQIVKLRESRQPDRWGESRRFAGRSAQLFMERLRALEERFTMLEQQRCAALDERASLTN